MLDQSVLTVLSSRVKLKRKHLPGDRKQQALCEVWSYF